MTTTRAAVSGSAPAARQHVAGGVTAWSLLSADRFEQSLALGAIHSTLWPWAFCRFGVNVRGTAERVRVFDAGGNEGASLEHPRAERVRRRRAPV